MNHKIKLLAVALAGAFSIGSAQADYSKNYGDVTGKNVTDTIYQRGTGSFIDYHFFQVSTPSIGTGIISDIEVIFFGTTWININNMEVRFGIDTGVVGEWNAGDIANELVGIGDDVAGQKLLGPGSYFFKITGDTDGWGLNIDGVAANGVENGAYFFNASAAPVPEPETWAMLLAGLGLVGLQLRRRNNAGKIAIN